MFLRMCCMSIPKCQVGNLAGSEITSEWKIYFIKHFDILSFSFLQKMMLLLYSSYMLSILRENQGVVAILETPLNSISNWILTKFDHLSMPSQSFVLFEILCKAQWYNGHSLCQISWLEWQNGCHRYFPKFKFNVDYRYCIRLDACVEIIKSLTWPIILMFCISTPWSKLWCYIFHKFF